MLASEEGEKKGKVGKEKKQSAPCVPKVMQKAMMGRMCDQYLAVVKGSGRKRRFSKMAGNVLMEPCWMTRTDGITNTLVMIRYFKHIPSNSSIISINDTFNWKHHVLNR